MLLAKMRKLFSFLKSAETNFFSENTFFARCVLLAFFILFFFLTRVPGLNRDVINPDGVNWHYRTQQFIVALKFQQFENTYQHYHPGVTVMWLTGIPIELYKQVTNIKVYDVHNFESFDFIAKFSLVVAQLVLSLLIVYVLSKVVGFYKAFFTLAFFTFEPFFVGNSRLYHLDAVLTLFMFLGLIFAFINLKKTTIWNSLLAGLFLALAFLTKSIAIGAIPFVVFYSAVYFLSKKEYKKFFFYSGFTVLFFALFTFLFFPALWVKPIYYLSFIFSEAARVGIRKGHGQIIFDEYTRDAGFWFYPLVFLVKSTPFILFGALAGLVASFRNLKSFIKSSREKLANFGLYILVFYFGYVVFMSYPAKKLDRYMLVVYPLLAYLAVVGYKKIWESRKKLIDKIVFWVSIVLFAIVFWIVPFVKIYPYYFTYTSPIVGSSQDANKIIAQKSFGVGINALKAFIVKNYSTYELPKLGFLDTKPMKAIYANSRVFDIRVYGPSQYDLLVLGVNEELPEDILNSKFNFEKDSSIWINGLEYWRIYVKTIK